MPIQQVMTGGDMKVPVKIWTFDIDEQTMQQLRNIAGLPFIHKHIAAMPDVHLGKGATVGSVIPTKGAIIPAAVGGDIGCGMNAVRLSLKASDLPDSLTKVRLVIEALLPVGQAEHKEKDAPRAAYERLNPGLERILVKHPKIAPRDGQKVLKQLGTMGGGNHFCELCLDENDDIWVMLHSGSRGIGNLIGRYFMEKAREEMARYFINLPDRDLAYLAEGSPFFDDYIEALEWAQNYALENRRQMMDATLKALRAELPPFTITQEAINAHHNYVAKENHYGENVYVTRKGAIRAREGDLGIIPGSMGTRSYIVRGKGNGESFCSCSHGAGRRMSRTKAKEVFTQMDLIVQTLGIECRKDVGVIDEIPGAYKPIGEVMANQSDLVEVIHELRQVLCIKG